MKKMIVLLISAIASVLSSTAGSRVNTPLSEIRESAAYHAIIVDGNAEIILIPSERPGVIVEGSKSQVYDMVTVLKDDTLFIRQVNDRDRRGERTKVYVNVDNLTLLQVTGKTNVTASGYINTDILTIRADKGAEVNLDVRALEVKPKATGMSFIRLSGTTGSLTCYQGSCTRMDVEHLDITETAIDTII